MPKRNDLSNVKKGDVLYTIEARTSDRRGLILLKYEVTKVRTGRTPYLWLRRVSPPSAAHWARFYVDDSSGYLAFGFFRTVEEALAAELRNAEAEAERTAQSAERSEKALERVQAFTNRINAKLTGQKAKA